CQQVIEGHDSWVTAVSFSPDSSLIASASLDKTVRICQADTGQCIRELEADMVEVRNVKFSPDSSLIAFACLNGDLQLCRGDTGHLIQSLKGHGKPVFGTEFSPDYTILGSFSQDRSVRTWKVATGECLHVLNGHSSLPATMSFSPDMSLIASGAHDRTVRIWRVNSDEDTRQPAADHDSIKSVIVSPGRTLVASSSERGKVRVWNIDTGECLHRDLEHGDEKIRSLAFYSNSKLIFARSLESETLWVWRVDTGQCVRKLSIVGSQQVSFSPNGQSITLIQKNNLLLLLAGETLHCNYRFKGSGPIFKQVFSPDSTLVAALSYPSKDCSGNPDLRIWSVDTGKLIWTIKGLEEGTETLAVSPDSKLVAVFMYCESGDGDGVYRFRVLQMETGKTICGGELDILGLRSVSFTHDSKYLALGSDDFVEIWDISSGERIRDINLGFYPSRFDFDTDREHLLTNFGSVSIDRSLPIATDWRSGCSNCRSGYGISGDRCWIMWDDTKFFWLPPALRPNTYCVEVSGSTIVLGSQTGRVLLFKFTIGELILKNRSLT
ncbi:WD40-repeat-containing domain protein, partial [Ilyonectria destructans]